MVEHAADEVQGAAGMALRAAADDRRGHCSQGSMLRYWKDRVHPVDAPCWLAVNIYAELCSLHQMSLVRVPHRNALMWSRDMTSTKKRAVMSSGRRAAARACSSVSGSVATHMSKQLCIWWYASIHGCGGGSVMRTWASSMILCAIQIFAGHGSCNVRNTRPYTQRIVV